MSQSKTQLISVSLPKELVKKMKDCIAPGKRSRVISRLLESYIRQQKKKEEERRYKEAYADPEIIALNEQLNKEFEINDAEMNQLLEEYGKKA